MKIEHPIRGSQVLLRVTMAIEAPLHGQRRRARCQGHGIDLPVAAFAPDALRNVDAVVEVDEIRELVEALPAQRSAAAECLDHRRQYRLIGVELGVAGHARRDRRYARECRLLYRGVTIPTANSVIADVVLVTERHRLLDGIVRRRPGTPCSPATAGRRSSRQAPRR